MRYATYLKGAALAASMIAAGVLMNGTASADVSISGYAAPAYGGPVYEAAPAYGYYERGPGPRATYGYAPTAYGYATPVTGPFAYGYARGYYAPYTGYFQDRDQP